MEQLMRHTTCKAFTKRIGKTPLSACMRPSSVAVVGATERPSSVGKTVVENLQKCLETVKGEPTLKIYPINPGRATVCGLPCYKDLESCPEPVDMAVIVTPASTVPSVVESCGKASIPIAVIISAGFKELGDEGLALETQVVTIAKKYGVRIVGPNCLGVMVPPHGLNATFAACHAACGSVAFISQSGAMCTAVLDWAERHSLGFSAFVSIGSMADLEWGDLLHYFDQDSETSSILLYMETIGDASHFLRAARSTRKPIIAIKAGQTEAAIVAAASHTGSLAGSYSSFVAAMKRAGVLLVDTIQDLCECALLVGKQPQPASRAQLLLLTNAGGPGVLATDSAAIHGACVYKLGAETITTLSALLPAAWSHANPVDILGDASAKLYAETLKRVIKDPEADGVLIILSPQSVTDPTETAKAIVAAIEEIKQEEQQATLTPTCPVSGQTGTGCPASKCPDTKHADAQSKCHASKSACGHSPSKSGCGHHASLKAGHGSKSILSKKTIFCSWMGGDAVAAGYDYLNAHGIPTFSNPDAAARAFGKLAKYRYEKETQRREIVSHMKPDSSVLQLQPVVSAQAKSTATSIITKARQEKRTLLTEHESKELLEAYGIPVASSIICTDAPSAKQAASKVGFPCVAKLHSETITHKSDVGGVILGIQSAEAAQLAFVTIQEKITKLQGAQHFQGITIQPMLDVHSGVELILGSIADPQLGNLILFGTGGCYVEIYKDTALALPPLDYVEAQLLLQQTKIYHALTGQSSQRFVHVDQDALLTLVYKFSLFIEDLCGEVAECDINPLLALPNQLVALDARVVLKDACASPLKTIRSYPMEYMLEAKTTHKQLELFVTTASHIHRLQKFIKTYLQTTPHLLDPSKALADSPFKSSSFKHFNLEDHIIPHMMFSDYARAIPIAVADKTTGSIIGCAYIRRHALARENAMLQFAFLPKTEDILDYEEIQQQLIQHILHVAKQEHITFIFTQLFRESEAEGFKKAGFSVEKNEATHLFICTFEV